MAEPVLLGRDFWTTLAASPTDRQEWPLANLELFFHYTVTKGRAVVTRAQQAAHMRALHRMHVQGNGWQDIGYNYILFQPWYRKGPATIVAARGRTHRPAAQGGHNTGTLACSVVAIPGEPIMERTVDAMVWLTKLLKARKVGGHRDVNSTSCPGDAIYRRLPEVRRRTGTGKV